MNNKLLIINNEVGRAYPIHLWQWFSEKEWTNWDKQIEEDSNSGKLDFLVEEALNEKQQNRVTAC